MMMVMMTMMVMMIKGQCSRPARERACHQAAPRHCLLPGHAAASACLDPLLYYPHTTVSPHLPGTGAPPRGPRTRGPPGCLAGQAPVTAHSSGGTWGQQQRHVGAAAGSNNCSMWLMPIHRRQHIRCCSCWLCAPPRTPLPGMPRCYPRLALPSTHLRALLLQAPDGSSHVALRARVEGGELQHAGGLRPGLREGSAQNGQQRACVRMHACLCTLRATSGSHTPGSCPCTRPPHPSHSRVTSPSLTVTNLLVTGVLSCLTGRATRTSSSRPLAFRTCSHARAPASNSLVLTSHWMARGG